MTKPPAIRLNSVGVLRCDRWILRDLNWEVPQGACAAVLGPNGSGKSTLARILAGHLWPTDGDVRILGQRFGEVDLSELRRSIRLLQPAGPCDVDGHLTARQVVVTGFFGTRGLYSDATREMLERSDHILDRVGLLDLAAHPYSSLSSGERLRNLIARALVQPPRLLLLDEPTAGLDLLAREQVLATIQALFEDGAPPPTVVLITHHVEELPPATSQVMVLSRGRAASQGHPREALRADVLSTIYDCPVKVRASGGRYYVEVHPEAWRDLISRRNGACR